MKRALRVLLLGPLLGLGLLGFVAVAPFVYLVLWLTNDNPRELGEFFKEMGQWYVSEIWNGRPPR